VGSFRRFDFSAASLLFPSRDRHLVAFHRRRIVKEQERRIDHYENTPRSGEGIARPKENPA
jgi:hypothetical protein